MRDVATYAYYYCQTAVQARFFFNAFIWATNTARGVRFLLRFIMYMFLA